MAYSQAQVDELRAAIARGAARLRQGDEEVQYASLAEMRRQLREMEAEMQGAPVTGPVVSYAKTSRGL